LPNEHGTSRDEREKADIDQDEGEENFSEGEAAASAHAAERRALGSDDITKRAPVASRERGDADAIYSA
jgi:hypothetical protein